MDEISINQNLYDFLLFSYFGITVDSDADEVISACIRRAYRDAASHVLTVEKADETAPKKLLNKLNENKIEMSDDKSRKNVLKVLGSNEIIKFISSLNKSEADFDDVHNNLCKALMNLYKDYCNSERCFTYGVAQKWVNMSVKYLYLLSGLTCFKYNCTLNGFIACKEYFHIPLDSYMIKAISETGKINNSDISGLSVSIKTYNLPNSWSKIDESKGYQDYQKAVIKKIVEPPYASPLDWECPAWIEASKAYK